MNPLDALPFMYKTKEEAEILLKEKGYTEYRFVYPREAITLQCYNGITLFINKDGKVGEIW